MKCASHFFNRNLFPVCLKLLNHRKLLLRWKHVQTWWCIFLFEIKPFERQLILLLRRSKRPYLSFVQKVAQTLLTSFPNKVLFHDRTTLSPYTDFVSNHFILIHELIQRCTSSNLIEVNAFMPLHCTLKLFSEQTLIDISTLGFFQLKKRKFIRITRSC